MAFQLQQQELGGLLSPLQAGAAHKQVGRGVHTEAGIERERTVRMPRPAPAARGFLVVTARKPGVGAEGSGAGQAVLAGAEVQSAAVG